MIINLTPHNITITVNGKTETFKPAGIARCKETSVQVGLIDGWIPVYETVFGEVEGLPEVSPGDVFVVSAIVAKAVKSRTDVYVPAKTIRDENGVIIGCIGLAKI